MTTASLAAGGEPLTEERLRQALSGRIEPVRVPVAYRAGLLLVAFATVLLPVGYLAVAVLAGWGVVLHATHNTWILARGGGMLFRSIAYVGPIVAGVVVVLFLFKPLFARPAARRSDLEIDAAEFPLVFALVEGICRAVGAPTPSRITMDCEVNASASFRRGLASFLGHDLQLTIGLPLATGLPLRQFAGVLAHEMGHFAQGSGMRLTYLVRSVNGWLARVVYERDEWDEKLTEWSERSDWRVAVILWAARLGVWLSHKILWALMLAGHAIGMLMMRQMEYDADRYEVRLAGSETFAATAVAMRVLSVSSMKATSTLARSYGERRLADDFPALVAGTVPRLPPDVPQRIEQTGGAAAKPGVFDTHPPDTARIERARGERMPGIFRLEHPAALLFGDLAGLCRRATEVHYRERHEIDLKEVTLEPTPTILAREDAVERDAKASGRVFGPLVSMTRPLALGGDLPPPAAVVADAVRTLRESREALGQLAETTRLTSRKREEASSRAIEMSGARVVLAAGFRPEHAASAVGLGDPQAAESAAEAALEERRAAEGELEPAREALRIRVETALSLLRTPEVRASVGDVVREETVEALLRRQASLAGQAAMLAGLMEGNARVAALLSVNVKGEDEGPRWLRYLTRELEAVHTRVRAILAELETVPYPFEHARGAVSLANFAADGMPPDDVQLSPFLQANQVLGRLHDFHSRVLGRLAAIVEDVERAVGLAPLELGWDEPPG